jgi:hypothetical protein
MIELSEQTAGEITDPDDQTRALAAVAGALVAVDLAEILAGERWLDALEPLGKRDPPALAAVDRERCG